MRTADDGRIPADAGRALGCSSILASCQSWSFQDKASDQHHQHANKYADAQEVSYKAVQTTDRPCPQEMKIRNKSFQCISKVYQEIINETPGNQSVKKARCQAKPESWLQGDCFGQDFSQALTHQAPVWLPLARLKILMIRSATRNAPYADTKTAIVKRTFSTSVSMEPRCKF
jgi:hypothetical protein